MVVQPLGTTQRVLVSCAAPTMFLNSGNWRQIQEALLSQLPLRNIHWKPASRTSIRTIQELDITLVNLDSLRDEHTSQMPATFLEKPLLNIYIIMCENTDMEGYKSSYKKLIKDWHSVITTRKNQEWLILHIVKPDARAPSGNFFQLKGSVLEKLRADFNMDKRDRCVQVPWSNNYQNPTSWAEATNKIKDGILSAFDLSVAQREEEVKRSESQRQMPGWNFCTFFILKESLPNSFEGVNLFEEALIQYDELEASFYHVLREKNLSWFGTLISPQPKDDSAPLLSISKKSYRHLILDNTISVFDFRIYLLGRQCELLAKMGHINEVGKKASAFLGAFGRRLRGVENTLPAFFIESWIYSSALSVVAQCDEWALRSPLEGPSLAGFNAGKAELLEHARHQLDVIGIKVGHLPLKPPFSTIFQDSSAIPSVVETTSSLTISNQDIINAIGDRERFYELYISTTNRAIELYAKGGRRKFALKLHGSLAALDVHRGHLSPALVTYSSLPAHYAPHMWTSLESLMLSRALDTHAQLEKPKDAEWIHILLAFLKTYVECSEGDMLLYGQDKTEYLPNLIQAMKTTAGELETDLPHLDHPALSVTIGREARPAQTRDGSFLDVVVKNHLPCDIPIDEVTIILGGRDTERYKFSAPAAVLLPGNTQLTLFCPVSAAGVFTLDTTEIRVAHLLFQWHYRKSLPSGKQSRGKKDAPILVKVPQDLLALDLRLQQPTTIELGRSPAVRLIISTGRNNLSKITVKLSVAGVTFYTQRATLDGEQEATLDIDQDLLTLSNVPEGTTVAILVPHSDVSAFHSLKINVFAEYITESEPDVKRTLAVSRTIITTLPISVNVEDFFRGKRLLSKFTITTTSHQHVRIADARLEVPNDSELTGIKITTSSITNRSVLTVTPAQPANFLFQLESTGGPVRDPLNLVVKYRMLREEVEYVIDRIVQSVLSDKSLTHHHHVRIVTRLVEALQLEASWVEIYRITGEVHVPETPVEPDDISEALHEAKKLLRANKHTPPPLGPWREIRIPVDVPSMAILAAVRIRVSHGTGISLPEHALYAGQPISAELIIHTSFHWGSSANNKERKFAMRFDIDEMVKDWLVSGQKRGNFIAMDDAIHSVSVTLVALHHGELALPRVSVAALPVDGEFTMGSMAIPTTETYQEHGAEKVLILPRGGRSTFVVGMGSS